MRRRRTWSVAAAVGLLGAVLAGGPGAADVPAPDWTNISPNSTSASSTSVSTGGRVNGLDIAPQSNQMAYAASEFGGLFATTDGGAHWVQLESHLPTRTWDVAVDPAHPNTIVATSWFDGRVDSLAGIQVSTDGGQTWAKPASATPPVDYPCPPDRVERPYAFGIDFDRWDSGDAYVGTSCGVAVTHDSGATFTFFDPTPETPADADVWDVAAAGSAAWGDAVVYACGSEGAFKSSDEGATWTPLSVPMYVLKECSLAVSPDEPNVVFLTQNLGRVFESDDGGGSWTEFAKPDSGIPRVAFVATNDRAEGRGPGRFDLWVGTGNRLFRADCQFVAGVTQPRCPPSGEWTNVQSGAHVDTGDVVFDTMVASDRCPLLYSNDGGIYRNTVSGSPDCHGPAWERANDGLNALWLWSLAGAKLAPGFHYLHIGLQDDGYFSTIQPEAASPSWAAQKGGDVFTIAPDAARVVYLPNSSTELTLAEVDGGNGAAVVPSPPGKASRFQFPREIGRVADKRYVVARSDVIGTNDDEAGLYTTPDITASPVEWTEVGDWPGGPAAANPCAVEVSGPEDSPTFYVQAWRCEGRPGDQLWKFQTSDSASGWTRVDQNHVPDGFTGFGVDPADPDRLYASFIVSGQVEVARSDDGGATWLEDESLTDLMTGFGTFVSVTEVGNANMDSYIREESAQPSLFAFNPLHPQVIVAGGRDSGVFLSSDGGGSWALATDPLTPHLSGVPHIPRPIAAHFDADSFGLNPSSPFAPTVWIGTQGRGVWRLRLPKADLDIGFYADIQGFVHPEEPVTYGIRVHNSGPDAVRNVTVRHELPPGAELRGVRAPAAWNCTAHSRSQTTVACVKPSGMSREATETIYVDLAGVSPNAAGEHRVTVAGAAYDPNPSDNVALRPTDAGGFVQRVVRAAKAVGRGSSR